MFRGQQILSGATRIAGYRRIALHQPLRDLVTWSTKAALFTVVQLLQAHGSSTKAKDKITWVR